MRSHLIAFVLGLGAASPALADPSTIYFYNALHGDNTDRVGLAFLLQQMGIVDANGTLGSVEADDRIRIGGNVVGHILRDDAQNAVGYKNATGTQEAYEIAGHSLDFYGFKRVTNGGRIQIISHGLVREREEEGVRKTYKGGAFQFGRFWTTGFYLDGTENGGTHTPIEGGFPARVTAIQNRTLQLDLTICYGSNDPDGAGMGNPQRSIKATAAEIAGINPVRGYEGKAGVLVNFSVEGGTDENKQALLVKLDRARRRSGFNYTAEQAAADMVPDLTEGERHWIAFNRYWCTLGLERQRTLQNTLVTGGALLRATYSITPDPQRGVGSPYEFTSEATYTPITSGEPMSSSTFTLSLDESSRGAAMVTVGPGDLSTTTTLHLRQLEEEPYPAPGGLPYLASGVFDFREFEDSDPFVSGELDYSFELIADAASDARLFFLSPIGWEPIPYAISDGRISGSLAMLGVFASFSSVPAPGGVALMMIVGGWSARRRDRLRA